MPIVTLDVYSYDVIAARSEMTIMIPTLETSRLLLRPMKISDIDELVHVFDDPRVMASFDVASFDRRQMEQWVERSIAHQDNYGYGLFSVILKHNGLLIGDCGLERMEIQGVKEVELGYELRSDYWNRGYATEAAIAVRDYAFHQLHLPRLTSLVRVGNIAAKRVSEKMGMTFMAEITHKNHQYWQYSIKRKVGRVPRSLGTSG